MIREEKIKMYEEKLRSNARTRENLILKLNQERFLMDVRDGRIIPVDRLTGQPVSITWM